MLCVKITDNPDDRIDHALDVLVLPNQDQMGIILDANVRYTSALGIPSREKMKTEKIAYQIWSSKMICV